MQEIQYPDGTTKYIYDNGEEETVYPDGAVEHLLPSGDWTVAYPDGYREAHTAEYSRRWWARREKQSENGLLSAKSFCSPAGTQMARRRRCIQMGARRRLSARRRQKPRQQHTDRQLWRGSLTTDIEGKLRIFWDEVLMRCSDKAFVCTDASIITRTPKRGKN